jgi:CRP-like cAMP-binding protein
MKGENLVALSRKVSVGELAAGRVLFKEGEAGKRTIWLISGLLELTEDGHTVAMLKGGTREASTPLPSKLPRRVTARAVDPIEYLTLDSDLLDMMVTWDQTGTYEVAELQAHFGTEGGDWMTTLLQTNAFHRIPPANIQAIFMKMERITRRAGDVIIQQGTEGDFFYAIVNGKCVVNRESPLNRTGIRLAELGVGETFGEEALISEAKRNATVSMLTDGVLMRLAKHDFRELMNDPMQQWVNIGQAEEIVAGGGRWLDVRLPSEHQNLAIDDSINIPLYFIRLKLSALNQKLPYIVYCDTGRRSSAAAFILLERGFDAYVLKGGIATANNELLRRPEG